MADKDRSGEDTVIDDSGAVERPLPGFSLESLVDQTLDERYTVDQLIGMGAMGAVFRARQTRLRRTVALKVAKPQLCLQSEFLKRFEREALTMAKIVHQNIVQIYDVCVSANHTKPSFIAMEFVEGVEFDRFLNTQREGLTVSAVLDLFKQIANGLDSAHQHGIVHRDIKPGNILVTMPQRVAKIMDFGIARIEMEDTFQTTEGQGMVGTPAYMAPEQISGGEITPATDIYALGMMFYRMLSGHSPWETRATHELLLAKINEPARPVSSRNGALPRALDKVLDRALAIDPERRQETAAQLVDEVSRALDPVKHLSFADLFDSEATAVALQRLSPRRKPESPHDRVAPGLLALLLIVSIAAAIMFLLPSGKKPEPRPNDVAVRRTPAVPATPTPWPSPTPRAESTPPPVSAAAPTPAPTAEPTASPTPEPTPTQAPTVADSATPPATVDPRWDPSLRPPSISAYRRQSLVEDLDNWLAVNIRRPMYRGHYDARRNVLGGIDSSTARDLVERFRGFQGSHDEATLLFTLRDDSAVWEDRALLRIDARIVARPKGYPQANYRETLWTADKPLEARVQRSPDDQWSLVAFD